MLDLAPDDELGLIVETARKLAREELLPRLREAESARNVSPELRASWSELGFTGLDLPEACDGAGLGCVARVLVNEEFAAGDAGAALALDPFGPAMTALLDPGSCSSTGTEPVTLPSIWAASAPIGSIITMAST